ncbi:Phosphoglycerate dehydrogenase [Streptomyces sp. LamerLS-316]|uniref:D-2-hydroxyacid dehydrogenase n=1 Tax=unclassified Streptomyces TaxID=2593676 RepID=UPI000823E172|nr:MULTISPECIES: D-2-hydroxyacid dehydrogenase [unclassified Streptomyces]MYQ41697.1 D-2-hydroxyacid dehydrogenase [Streptomyces sp. SID4921]SCK27680.1 Phosphoglycerate dehydrogenase [Streptomyces sp. LamerLS-316]
MTPPLPGPLARARLLASASVAPAVVRELERITGRPAEADPATAPDGPFVYVGDVLPEALRAPGLLWFHSVYAGTDALLAAGPWPEGALLTRTVGRMGERIAQYTLAWVLAECQSVPEHTAQHSRSEWRRLPSELAAGQTAVVHGTGNVGAAIAGLLRACSVRTVGVGRTPRSVPAGFERVVLAGSDEETAALAEARWVISTLPLTEATEGYFDTARFTAMKGATFVNVGRGATVDMAALEAALHSGAVRRAVLDVLPDEPADPGDPVWRLPRTVITSHSAGITADEDVVADFGACWEAVGGGRTPALAVDTGRGY